MKKILILLLAASCIYIGLYPISYFLNDEPFKLLRSKSTELLASQLYTTAFYLHISFGGIALLIGWLQFSKRLRAKYLQVHKIIGKTYITSVMISGPVGLYIAYFANGGISNVLGFGIGAILWTIFTYKGYRNAVEGNIVAHQKMMIYSYAGTFGAVTLRIWLPILIFFIGNFNDAYQVVAWLSWVPNIFIAYLINNRMA